MGLATDIQINCNESIQVSLEQIDFFQDQIKIIDNEKVTYDESIRRLDANLIEQANEVNRAFNVVESAYQDRIAGICKTDLFWRVTDIDSTQSPPEYSLVCTKLTPGGYEILTKENVVGLGSTVGYLHPGTTDVQYFPCNDTIQEELGIGFGYTFGFDPRNYYGLKYYDEPYSEDIGNTFVASFIGTITQASNKLTVMNPVGAGVSDVLEIGQLVVPEFDGMFAGSAKITGITTGLTDLRYIDSLVGIATTQSFVNILTLDTSALQTLKAPRSNGTYGSFEVLDDPDTVVDTGRYLYQVNKEKDPFTPQTVGIMQTSTIGIGVSIALDNSGYPTASMGWDPTLNGWDVSEDPNRQEIVYPPRVGSGKSFWRVGFSNFPRASVGSATKAIEGAVVTGIEEGSDLESMYGSLSACSGALNTAVTNAGVAASTAETDLIGGNSIRNLKADGLNALRGERNEKYSLRIFGMRVSIGQLNEEMDRLATLRTYLGDATIRDVMDESIPPTGA